MNAFVRWKRHARHLKRETFALYLAYRDPRVPWYAKLIAACVVGYAFSPIDLIPDFIPILGYVDDLVLVPLGIALALRLIPPPVMAECRLKAGATLTGGRGAGPAGWVAGAAIATIWLLLAALAISFILRLWRG
jgi:uncharacterized membrane protein YkvA (DUF1232 family)